MSAIRRFLDNESGATAIEYSLIAALIGVVIISAVRKLGTSVSAKFGAIAGNMT
jgi:pilus assembly protein Flp/PilA